jgi:ATP-dependent helicase Lhr and Lhr-like helicase
LATKAKTSAGPDPLAPFSAPVRRWFEASFEGPTPAQAGGWEAIASGANALICAPTGSGKTLAAFLWAIDQLARTSPPTGRNAEPGSAFRPVGGGGGVRLVYVSPLKALSYDIERNLRAPLRGIGADISVGIRTGDTSQSERRAMRKTPPDILITTPESLYLMLSSGVREILTTTEAVIVDEIHAVAQSKRGSHLALSLERLEHLVKSHADRPAGPVAGGGGGGGGGEVQGLSSPPPPPRHPREMRPVSNGLGFPLHSARLSG